MQALQVAFLGLEFPLCLGIPLRCAVAWKKCCHPSHWVHLSHPYQLHTTSSRKLYNPPVLEKIKCFIRDLSIYIHTKFILLKQKWNIGMKLSICIFHHKVFTVWCLKSLSFISSGKVYAKVSVYWLLEYVRHPCGMLCECSVICYLYILIIWNFMGCIVSKICTLCRFWRKWAVPLLLFVGLKPRVLIETLFWNAYSSGRFWIFLEFVSLVQNKKKYWYQIQHW